MTAFEIDSTGWLKSADVVASPNFDARPENVDIKLVVVHGISLPPGEFGGGYIQQFFCNRLDTSKHQYFSEICEMQVSAHCLIERGGGIVQFVSFLDRAWHAGQSNWHGEENCNNFSIGIELEGTDEMDYDESQYRHLAKLIECLRATYSGIEADAICGHSDIAPGRKTDPGPSFDWSQLNELLRH